MTNLIDVSKEAVEEFNRIKQRSKNPENVMLRINFGGGGWAGPRFNLTLDEFKDEDDIVEELDGIKIIYRKRLADRLKGAVIYYSNSWFNRGLAIDFGRTC